MVQKSRGAWAVWPQIRRNRAGRYNFFAMVVGDVYSLAELRELTAAGLSLTSEMSLDVILQRLVDLAREQSHARYGALSVLGPRGEVERFVTSGVTDKERGRIGDIPRGRGLLAVLLKEGSSLRLNDIGSDPRAVGFPPHHPRMKSLLGVPVVVGDRIIGNLYLTDKEGAEAFADRDEELVRLLATQAAVAVRNAELYAGERRRTEEWKALFELSREVSASPRLRDILDSTVSRARLLLGADVAALMLLESDGESFRMTAYEGLRGKARKRRHPVSDHGLQRLALESGGPVLVRDCRSDPRLRGRRARLVEEEGLVSAIAVPLMGKEGALGTLCVGNRAAVELTERQAELLEAFANWTAVAIEASQLYDKLEGLARLEERERIGMDLHDGVIQSIYAVGLHLEHSAESLPDTAQGAKREIESAIDDLNDVIKDIRSYIFDLRPRMSQVPDLPHAIELLVEDTRVNTLMNVQAKLEQPLNGALSEAQALALFHIAQEALANISKHSRASRAFVRLSSRAGHVKLAIRDNGVGFEPGDDSSGEKHGLRNMRDRARSVGASLVCESTPGRGTRVTVDVPIRRGE